MNCDAFNVEADKIHLWHCILYEFDFGYRAKDTCRKFEGTLQRQSCNRTCISAAVMEKYVQSHSGRPNELESDELLVGLNEEDNLSLVELA